MKRLTILTVLAMMMMASSGCCRSRSAFRWPTSNACNPCSEAGTYSGYPGYEAGYDGGTLLPPPMQGMTTQVLPAPLPNN
jgi:hypothetical protein